MNDNKQKPKKIRGTMENFYDDSLHFTPQGTGQPQFEPLKKSSGGALMRTTGENTRFLAIHPKVPPTLPPSCRPSRRPARPARKLLKGLPSLPSEPILRGRK